MDFDVVIIGGGLAGMTAAAALQKAGRKCAVVSAGVSLHPGPRAEFLASGGAFFGGDAVSGGVWKGNVLEYVFTGGKSGARFYADDFVLATGKFFSRGLVSTMDGVYEPVFGCDVDYVRDRDLWVCGDFFAPQPFESFGVVVDAGYHVMIGGKPAANLYAAGEILRGRPDITGSALKVCEEIQL